MCSYTILGLRPIENFKARKALVIRCTKRLNNLTMMVPDNGTTLDKRMNAGAEIKRSYRFDAVVVWGGNIRLVNGNYVSTPYEEGTEKSFGGCGRALTAAMFYHWGVAPRFIVSTGRTHPNPDAPTEAAIMKTEMIDYGVPADRITEEGRSLNTLENAIEVAKLLRSEEFKQCKRIGLVTNSWHLRRSLVFFAAQGLIAEGRRITLISSDKIVGEIMPEFKSIIRELYHTASMAARLKREKQGVIDFYVGRYKPGRPRQN